MKEQLVTFETAKLAKEKRFKESCTAAYRTKSKKLDYPLEYTGFCFFKEEDIKVSENNQAPCILAPTQSLLQKWLREEHNLIITPIPDKVEGEVKYNIIIDLSDITYTYDLIRQIGRQKGSHIFEDSYEKALEKGLQEALKLIK